MLTTITEIRCRNYWKLPAFLLLSVKVAGQARKSPGNISTNIKARGLKGFTLTVWKDRQSMKAFRNSGKHMEAMKTMNKTASALRFKTLESETAIGWDEALAELETIEMRFMKH